MPSGMRNRFYSSAFPPFSATSMQDSQNPPNAGFGEAHLEVNTFPHSHFSMCAL